MPAKKSDHLYDTLGLYEPIGVVVRGQPLPVILNATVLPFKGQIICDGLVEPYTILPLGQCPRMSNLAKTLAVSLKVALVIG